MELNPQQLLLLAPFGYGQKEVIRRHQKYWHK
jgi:hypothetical protein